MKVANWNVEWMNDWFVSDSEAAAWRPRVERGDRPVEDVQGLAARVAAVIRTIDPDVLALQEGPSRVAEMELFVADHLDGSYVVLGPSGKGQQKLYTLVRRDGPTAAAYSSARDLIDLASSWEVDLDGRLTLEEYAFTRAPLIVVLRDCGRDVLLVNLHTKSKFVQNGARRWREPSERQGYIVDAMRNRRRIAAELMRARLWIDAKLRADEETPIIVAGDLNEGPGLDFFESFYLSHDSVAIVAGSPFDPRIMLRHAFIDSEDRERNWTARFDDFIDGVLDRPLLLDHILLSQSLNWGAFEASRIEHEAFEAELRPELPGRAGRPSDHRPQSATFRF
jgi:endonuclease/exonuclease/phosphatase family metal-dependent hydrolase